MKMVKIGIVFFCFFFHMKIDTNKIWHFIINPETLTNVKMLSVLFCNSEAK